MRHKRKSANDILPGFLFLLPNLIGFLIFVSIPILFSLILSFFKCDLLQTRNIVSWQFVGWDNFIQLLGWHHEQNVLRANDPQFWQSLGNTLFLMLKIPLTILLSLFLALLLNKKLKGIAVFRTLFFLPTICIGTAIYILWRWLFNADFGLINLLIAKLSNGMLSGPQWLVTPIWAKPAFIIMNIWAEMGGLNMIIYLAALQQIPQQYYESASLDGAGRWARFFNITFPLLGPTTFFILIINLINGFQTGFQQAHIMTRGGPAGATTTISYYIYHQAYIWNHMGYAAASAWMLFLVVALITALTWHYGGKKIYYR